jgi:molybdopterin molybdotransferase
MANTIEEIPRLGFAAWSGAGKTTLLVQVLPLLRAGGLRLAMLKHAHHAFDIDKPGKDSYELRKAGAEQMLVVSSQRLALMVENPHQANVPPTLTPPLSPTLTPSTPSTPANPATPATPVIIPPATVSGTPSETPSETPSGIPSGIPPGIPSTLTDAPEPSPSTPTPVLETLLRYFDPTRTDLILVEGFKHAHFPKIEIHRPALGKPLLCLEDPDIIAVATDTAELELPDRVRRLPLNQPEVVARFIGEYFGLPPWHTVAADSAASCFSSPTGALSVAEALERILQHGQPVPDAETVPLAEALDRVLSQPLQARLDVPPAPVSAMDGYALRLDDLDTSEGMLRLVGVSAAGHPWTGPPLQAGECIRILTGAVVPESADTIAIQENVRVEGEQVRVLENVRQRGANIRARGEDTCAGQPLLEAGHRLSPIDIGLLAAQGIARVAVHRLVRVAFFTTGDELVALDQPLGPGQIHDSNRHALRALLSRYPVQFTDLGLVPDDPEAVRATLRTAAQEADLLLTTGGVSVGDADHVMPILREEGQVNFWKIAMKPGRPLAFGRVGHCLFLGLPGNPVSVLATFSLFVRPALLQLAGLPHSPPGTLRARLCEDLPKAPGRQDYQRGILQQRSDGEWEVRSAGGQGSHQLRSMSLANAYIVLPAASADATAGTWVEVLPFSWVF